MPLSIIGSTVKIIKTILKHKSINESCADIKCFKLQRDNLQLSTILEDKIHKNEFKKK